MRHQIQSRLLGLEERLDRSRAEGLETGILRRIDVLAQRLSRAGVSLRRATSYRIEAASQRLAICRGALSPEGITRWIEGLTSRRQATDLELRRWAVARLDRERSSLAGLVRVLDSVSPLSTLARGFAVATDSKGDILRTAATVAIGAEVQVTLADGGLGCRVETVHTTAPLRKGKA
jgi:exodeoxyribonuclease VII large subunit